MIAWWERQLTFIVTAWLSDSIERGDHQAPIIKRNIHALHVWFYLILKWKAEAEFLKCISKSNDRHGNLAVQNCLFVVNTIPFLKVATDIRVSSRILACNSLHGSFQ